MFEIRDDRKALALRLYDIFKDADLSYIYQGQFTQAITDFIIMLAETGMDRVGESAKIKKRVFSIMVESLQNITRHHDDGNDYQGFFAIEQKDGNYYITTVNHIFNSNIERVDGLLKKIQSLQAEDLKSYYKEVLIENEISAKGGAGLGLIEIARKSNNKVSYHFHKVDDQFSYFYFHTCITPRDENDEKETTELVRIENIFMLHQMLQDKEVQLIFNGIFTQENLIHLLNIIESHMAGKGQVKRLVFNIMVEMVQNIVKHGVQIKEKGGNPGIFFINKQNNSHVLNTGNYIFNNEIPKTVAKIDYINSLNYEELNDYYDKSLFNFKEDDSKGSGLGLIELRMKSNYPLRYAIQDIDEIKSFIIIQVFVD